MKTLFACLTLILQLFATTLSPVYSANFAAAPPFKPYIDERRTLHLDGTEAAETIVATINGEPTSLPDASPATRAARANIAIDYRLASGTSETQQASFSLESFDRIMVNAGGGDDLVNIIDAGELLDASKKILNLNGGDGDNIVVVSHLPFKP